LELECVTVGVDCPATVAGSGFSTVPTGVPSETQCLWHAGTSGNENFCVQSSGLLLRGSDCIAATPAPVSKRDVADVAAVAAKRHSVTAKVAFRYVRVDEKLNEHQTTCGPELRVLVDGVPVAHSKTDGSEWPKEGEGALRIKLSVDESVPHPLIVQYRDGADCDAFDDDDDAEREWISIADGLPGIGSCTAKKRSVESSSSSSSSSSDGTSLSVEVREKTRLCVVLDQAVLVESHADDDDDE